MADDAYTAPFDVLQALEGLGDGIEAVGAEGAEPLVDEKGVGRCAAVLEGREPKGEGQRHHETFASREGVEGADVTGIAVVDHDFGGIGARFEAVAAAEHLHVVVGAAEQLAEDEGTGDAAEAVAGGASKLPVEVVPEGVVGLEGLNLHEIIGMAPAVGVVGLERGCDASNLAVEGGIGLRICCGCLFKLRHISVFGAGGAAGGMVADSLFGLIEDAGGSCDVVGEPTQTGVGASDFFVGMRGEKRIAECRGEVGVRGVEGIDVVLRFFPVGEADAPGFGIGREVAGDAHGLRLEAFCDDDGPGIVGGSAGEVGEEIGHVVEERGERIVESAPGIGPGLEVVVALGGGGGKFRCLTDRQLLLLLGQELGDGGGDGCIGPGSGGALLAVAADGLLKKGELLLGLRNLAVGGAQLLLGLPEGALAVEECLSELVGAGEERCGLLAP